jgi:hypothetical protein
MRSSIGSVKSLRRWMDGVDSFHEAHGPRTDAHHRRRLNFDYTLTYGNQ